MTQRPWGLLTLLCAFAGAAGATRAAPNLEGTWIHAQSIVQLKPANGQPIPFTDKGRAAYESNEQKAAKGDLSFDLTASRCSSPGMPRMMLLPLRMRIHQNVNTVLFQFEWNRLTRPVSIGGTPAEPETPTMRGVSSGRWQGDTLVVKTIGFSYKKLLDNFLPSSDELELEERIRLRGRSVLEDRITITDPSLYTRPWDAVVAYRRTNNDKNFAEDVCLDRIAAGQPALPR